VRLRAKFALLVIGIIVVPALVVSLGILFRELLSETSDTAPSYYRRIRMVKSQLESALGSGEQDLAHIDAEPLRQLAEGLPGSGFVIVDAAGMVLMSTLDAPAVGSHLALTDLIAHARRNTRDFQINIDTLTAPNGSEALLISTVPRDPGRRRVAALPGAPAMPVVQTLNLGLYATGALLLFATLASVLILRSLTRSITELETATRRIAGGDLAFELRPKGRDEVASLTRSFEHMRVALREEEARRARFIMGVSHDLKTPLALIEGYVEAIADGYAEGKPETLEHYLAIIREKSRSLGGMIDSLIDFARMETGEWKLTHHRVKAATYFRDLGRRFAEDALLLQRSFDFEVPVPEGLEISMDETLVTRALENLVGNALRYTGPGGTISMSARTERREPAEVVVLAVRDTGMGIPAEELDSIFDPFYRGTGSRREEGHGLGLAVVKWVIESHGWTIAVSSEVGTGTTFTLTIPA
jgi:signal transduction histidine kinase